MKAKKSKSKKSPIIIKPPTLHCDWDKLGFDPFDPAGIESAIKISEEPDPLLPTVISPKYAALLRDCGDRFRQFVSNEDHVWECTEGAMAGKVVVVQRREGGKGRIAFFSPQAKWKTVKVKLKEKW